MRSDSMIDSIIDGMRKQLPELVYRCHEGLNGIIGLEAQTLANMAVNGDGPPSVLIGGKRAYEREALLEWLRLRLVKSKRR